MHSKFTGGSLTENKIIDSLNYISGTKPQATTYRNRHRIPKLTQGLYRKQSNRTTSN
jgi:hypothetical protein